MNIPMICGNAHASLRQCQRSPRRMTLYYLLFLFAVSVPCNLLFLSLGERMGTLQGFHAMEARNEYYRWFSILSILLALYGRLLETGYRQFALKISKGQAVSVKDFAAGFRMLGQFLLLYILEAILIFLWSMLFVIPGLIAMYRYRLAVELMLDDPSLSPLDAIRESKQLTEGHKMELFALDLRFLLHFLLLMAAEHLADFWELLGNTIHGNRELLLFYGIGIIATVILELWEMPLLYTSRANAYLILTDSVKTEDFASLSL